MTQQSPHVGVPVCYRHPDRETHIRCQRCNRPICPDCMRNASVGFQCPSCVAEGQRSARKVKPFTGARVGMRAAPVTYTLIGINVLIWALINLTGRYSSRLLELFALRTSGTCTVNDQAFLPAVKNAQQCTALDGYRGFTTHWVAGVSDGAPWQVLTSAFTHVEIWHIAVNMFSLYVLGTQLEPILGRARFLAVYLISGLAGSALVYWAADPHNYTLGASGALFGVMGAFSVFLIKAKASLQPLILTLVVNFAITFAVPGISWQGHVGGFIGGVATGLVLVSTRSVRRQGYQVGGLVGIGFVVVLAILLRSAMLA